MQDYLISKVFDRAASDPDVLAVVRDTDSMTYGQLAVNIARCANAYRALGVAPGDRVLIAAEPGVGFPCAYLGIHMAGGVGVPVAPDILDARLEYLCEQVAPTVLVGDFSSDNYPVRSAESLLEADETVLMSSRSPDDLADIMFTSGTTGNPKGVMMNYAAQAVAAQFICETLGQRSDDVEVVPVPLSHAFGLGRLRCQLYRGGTIVMTSGGLPGEVINAVVNNAATAIATVPAGWAMLLRFAQEELGELAGQLRYIEIGSQSVPLAHKQQLMTLLPTTRLWLQYGLSEAPRSVFLNLHQSADKIESVGKAASVSTLRVVDADDQDVEQGAVGQLLIQGEHLAYGYWNDPERSREVFADGWMHTGDIVRRDEDGFIWVLGRMGEVVNVGGYDVSPFEIETHMNDHPEVSESGCIGIPDPAGIADQVVCVFVVCVDEKNLPSEVALQTWMRSRVEKYKRPARIVFVSELPKTATGKIQRHKLKYEEEVD